MYRHIYNADAGAGRSIHQAAAEHYFRAGGIEFAAGDDVLSGVRDLLSAVMDVGGGGTPWIPDPEHVDDLEAFGPPVTPNQADVSTVDPNVAAATTELEETGIRR